MVLIGRIREQNYSEEFPAKRAEVIFTAKNYRAGAAQNRYAGGKLRLKFPGWQKGPPLVFAATGRGPGYSIFPMEKLL